MTAFQAPLPAAAPTPEPVLQPTLPLAAAGESPSGPELLVPPLDPMAPVELVLAAAASWPAGDAAAALQSCLEQAALLHQPHSLERRRLWLRIPRQRLGCRDLQRLQQAATRVGLTLVGVSSAEPTTLVAAAALGLETAPVAYNRGGEGPDGHAGDSSGVSSPVSSSDSPADSSTVGALQVHRGTLRAGDQLEAKGSLLVLGDVNPGASVRAGGHVLVWGRLRGTAHAGCRGDEEARIVALQLRPLQLRIAGCVARGPDAIPPAGLAEEARLVEGSIRIDPARPSWPLA